MKRYTKIITLTLILLLSLCFIACRKDVNPKITNKDLNYFEAIEDGINFSVTNQSIYEELLKSYGLSSVISAVDKRILTQLKNSDGISFYDAVDQKDVDDAFEKITGIAYIDDETEKAQALQKYLDNAYLSGNNEATIKEAQRLMLAQRAYAKVKLIEQIAETDKEAEEDDEKSTHYVLNNYISYYNSYYYDSYFALIVPYTSPIEATNALYQIGIEIVDGKWTKEGLELDDTQILLNLINLYNSQKARYLDTYPGISTSDRETLKEGVHYNIVEGQIVFNTTLIKDDNDEVDKDAEENRLYYTRYELSVFNNAVFKYVDNIMTSYEDREELTDNRWFTTVPLSGGNGVMTAFVVKIKVIEKQPLWKGNDKKSILDIEETIKDEIFDKLVENELNQTIIDRFMNELRRDNKLIIYDRYIQNLYANRDNEFKTTNKKNDTIVAKIDGFEYTADMLFEDMQKYAGPFVVASLIYERYLSLPKFNKVYNYLGTGSEKSNILSGGEDDWANFKQQVVDEKKAFNSGAYESYGYPKSFGWNNFIKDLYGVNNDFELTLYYLFTSINGEQMKLLGDLTEIKYSDDLWKDYERLMAKKRDEYFSVTGEHFLIGVMDTSGNYLEPTKWTNYQRMLVSQLYDEVLAYLGDITMSVEKELTRLAEAFSTAPYYMINLDQDIDSQPEINGTKTYYLFEYTSGEDTLYIDLSKYKSAGIEVRFQNLGTFNNGAMVSEFNDAVKYMYSLLFGMALDERYDKIPVQIYNKEMALNAGIESDDFNSKVDEETGEENYLDQSKWLITKFGYHIYINLNATALGGWDSGERNIIRQLAKAKEVYLDVKEYTEDDWNKMDLEEQLDIGRDLFLVDNDEEDWDSMSEEEKLAVSIELYLDIRKYTEDDFDNLPQADQIEEGRKIFMAIRKNTRETWNALTKEEKLAEGKELYLSKSGNTEDGWNELSEEEQLANGRILYLAITTPKYTASDWDALSLEVTIALPTLQMIKSYVYSYNASYLYEIGEDGLLLKNADGRYIESDVRFTDAMKNAVSTYYSPIFDEFTGDNNYKLVNYNALLDLIKLDNLKLLGGYSVSEFEKFLEITIAQLEENLQFIGK